MGTIKVLIIDHYDSYTNNILQLLQGTQKGPDGSLYPEWSVSVFRFDQFSWYVHRNCLSRDRLTTEHGVMTPQPQRHFTSEILPSLDAIILSPGPGTPE
ncbi:Uncharacterized protein TPAR_08579 [Tolypocladium paradoxum]|uniref:Glutamine amidotransferase domain-containing protein n=1 Tax=Tolypocladium paradoxum TaxID=94208 RepID=A0A2S4KLY1_9HYPO|nr:Uncharacterized protein TPAR_08579 [Tolypocladium paradoxum]